jgi:glutathione S-transferase
LRRSRGRAAQGAKPRKGSLRLTLYGSPHSLPTYKVALMLQLSGAPFAFRYVSFQRGMHKDPEFLQLSRWGQVPVLLSDGEPLVQSAAILEKLALDLQSHRGGSEKEWWACKEWLYWEADVLFPPVFGLYGISLGERGLLPIRTHRSIAEHHRSRARAALAVLDEHLKAGPFLCGPAPTIADIACYADLAFARLAGMQAESCMHVGDWARRLEALPRFRAPFELLGMQDAQFAGEVGCAS